MEYIILLATGGFIFYMVQKCFTKTCEDSYQFNKSIATKNQSDIYMVTEFTNRVPSVSSIKDRIKMLNDFFELMNTIKVDTNHIYTTMDEFNQCREYNCKLFADYDSNKITACVDHSQIGGSKLAWLAFIGNDKRKQKDLFYHSHWWFGFYALRLLWNKNNIPKSLYPLPLYREPHEIKRYMYKYKFDRTTSVKATILYNVLRDLYKCCSLDRPLVCYLPIAFHPTEYVYNNIGIIWLTYDQSDTIQSIAEQLERNKYQALATNFLVQYHFLTSSNGTKVRNEVDAVITMITSEENPDVEVSSKSWTFYNIPDYPIYVSISSILQSNTVHITQSLTVSTPTFDIKNSNLDYNKTSCEYYGMNKKV